jgi:putative Holliday junction resolvase
VKLLALDYGRARTGVAVSDPTGTVARPLCVVEGAASEDGLARLAALIEEEGADRVVVGLPLTLRGERGEQARETERFVGALSARMSVPIVTFVERLRAAVEVPVELFDERFTTDLAEQVGGSGDEDARAAAHLLSSYLTWSSGARA